MNYCSIYCIHFLIINFNDRVISNNNQVTYSIRFEKLTIITLLHYREEAGANFDFLSSIEILIIDQADVIYMQNWEHLMVINWNQFVLFIFCTFTAVLKFDYGSTYSYVCTVFAFVISYRFNTLIRTYSYTSPKYTGGSGLSPPTAAVFARGGLLTSARVAARGSRALLPSDFDAERDSDWRDARTVQQALLQ